MLRNLAGAVLLTLLLPGCSAADAFRYESKAREAVAKQLLDPTSAQFRNIAVRKDHVCGEVNAKNSMGAYVGFQRFVVNVSNWNAQLDPKFDYSDLFAAEDLCTSMRNNDYSSVASTISACDRADEKRALRLQQQKFDSTWNANCAVTAQLPFQPPLADNSSVLSEEMANAGENDATNDAGEAGQAYDEEDADNADDANDAEDADDAAQNLPVNAALQAGANNVVEND
jgi:hypothetical protein